MKDMKRVFSYHGAEHKTIRCYEAQLPLTVENVRPHDEAASALRDELFVRRDDHLDSGVFRCVQLDLPYQAIACCGCLSRLALLPVVVAISYEFNRFVGRHDNLADEEF